MKDEVKAHTQNESMDYEEIIPAHIDRKKASQSEFDNAKRFLAREFKGKRCIVCEMRGEKPKGYIEAHHVFEWCHWNDNNMEMVETTLRALSPFVHGMYMINKKDILKGERIPSLWEHSELKHKKFDSLDDPRNLFFLCHAHHQQSTNEQTENGYDILGLHNVPFTEWLQYMGMPKDKIPVRHAVEKMDNKVRDED